MVCSLRLESSKHSRRAGLLITSPPRQDILNRMGTRKMLWRLWKVFFRNAKNRVSPNLKPCWIGVIPQQREWLLALRNCWWVVAVVRCCPCPEALLRSSYPLRDDDRKRRRKHYYDRHAKPLPNVSPGEIVRMRLPGQKVWTPATCLDSAGPRSFLVKSGSTVYRRNRRDIIKTSETPVSSQTVVPKETPLLSSSGKVSPGHTTVYVPSTLASCMPSVEPPSFQPDVPPTDLRRSQRERRPPARFRDYVLTWLDPQPDFATVCWRLFFAGLSPLFFFYIYIRGKVWRMLVVTLTIRWIVSPMLE